MARAGIQSDRETGACAAALPIPRPIIDGALTMFPQMLTLAALLAGTAALARSALRLRAVALAAAHRRSRRRS